MFDNDPDFVPIGFPTLVAYRNEREVPMTPYGTLADYIPFYFWYRSPMLYVIHKGNDPEVIKTPQEEIIYLVSSIEQLIQHQKSFVFSDRHAKFDYAHFYNNQRDLSQLNWEIIKSENWGRQYGKERRELKQAECLAFQYLPISALIGIAVIHEEMKNRVEQILLADNVHLPVRVKRNFYF